MQLFISYFRYDLLLEITNLPQTNFLVKYFRTERCSFILWKSTSLWCYLGIYKAFNIKHLVTSNFLILLYRDNLRLARWIDVNYFTLLVVYLHLVTKLGHPIFFFHWLSERLTLRLLSFHFLKRIICGLSHWCIILSLPSSTTFFFLVWRLFVF